MPHPSRGIRRATVAVLGGSSLALALTAGLASPASAADSLATVSSTPTNGIRIVGSTGVDKLVLSRAGTAAAPLVHIDAASPLSVLPGCSPVVGDATRALCAAPLASSTTLKTVVITAGTGNDQIAHGASQPIPMNVTGGRGNDVILGGPGKDLLHGGLDDDIVRGGDNTDELTGGSGNDTLDGGPGRDDGLHGGSGNDTLLGGDGDSDDLDGSTGADTFDGGPGRLDIVLYDSRSASVTVDLTSTTATNGQTGEQDRILGGVENVFGGKAADLLIGNDGDNNLLGGDGNDLIFGGRGQDAVIGGNGDDLLSGNTLNLFGSQVPNADGRTDFIGGQAGNDTCIKSAADPDSVTECETVSIDG